MDRGEGRERPTSVRRSGGWDMAKAVLIAIVVLGIVFWGKSSAYAYIDPTIGGYIFQLLFPAILVLTTIGLFFKGLVRRMGKAILNFIGRVCGKEPRDLTGGERKVPGQSSEAQGLEPPQGE